MELYRALALAVELPGPALERTGAALDLGALPSAAEYTDLFEFQLYPYASVYLGGEGMLGGEARDRIAGFWRALGEVPPPEPDHLAVLLAAAAELAEREAGSEDDGIRSRWRHARRAFLWEHLASWLPVYLDKVAEIGPEFYRKWAALLGRVLARDLEDLGALEALPLPLREARPLGDLGDAGGDEFLQALTTPVRTGMILVRSDLERCARSLELGIRKGERRFALKSLFGQAPRETLEWLAAEADGWVVRFDGRTDCSPSIASFWRQRAETAARFLRSSAEPIPRS